MTVSRFAHARRVAVRTTGVAAGALGLLIAAGSAFMFHFTLDDRAPISMMKLVKAGKIKGAALEGEHRDADEEVRAARWFERVKEPTWTVSEDGLRLHAWMLPPSQSPVATSSLCSPLQRDASLKTVENQGIPAVRHAAVAGGATHAGTRDAAAHAGAQGVTVDERFPYAPTHRYVILQHGYTGRPREMAKYARRFADMGFTAIAPAARGHELSEGRYVGMGWLDRRDLMQWVRFVVRHDPQARIMLYGVSMGAAAVMMTVGETDLPDNVVAAIEDCGYSSVWDQFMENAVSMYHLPARCLAVPVLACMSLCCRLRAGYGFRQASSVRQLRRSHVPMLFIHGSADTFVAPTFLDRNFAACASPDKTRLVIDGAGHAMSASADPDRYWAAVGAFIRRVCP
ncbi:alpha/beta hydrolase [Bifidobacterium leontopitheci]|nr:alpha/beta hydrolase [Bifidobacterium leontopitheci]